jgi:hypothetical protein
LQEVTTMQVRIYQPPKTAMQSGQANTRSWVLEFEPAAPRQVEPLMGWTSSRDTRGQVQLRFGSSEEDVHAGKAAGEESPAQGLRRQFPL